MTQTASLWSHTDAAPRKPHQHGLRVLHVLPSLHQGGMENALCQLLRTWSAETDTDDAHGLVILGEADPDLLLSCREFVSVWSFAAHGRCWQSVWRLRKLMREFAPDIVHARTTSVWLDAALAVRGFSDAHLVLGFHGREHIRKPGWFRRVLLAHALRQADALVTLSFESAEWIRSIWPACPREVRVIPNGVDATRFRPGGPSGSAVLRNRLRLESHQADTRDSQSSLVLCVANLLPIKGLDVLLQAWRRVRMIVPEARLTIVGEGPQRVHLTSRMESLRLEGGVVLAGTRTDIPELMRSADLFVLPSWYECCSNALLEAMASGLPCVATAAGGNTELIRPHQTGWLVPSGDAGALAEFVIAALLNRDARERVGLAAREYVLRHHQWDHAAHSYRDLYQHLATNASSPSTHDAVPREAPNELERSVDAHTPLDAQPSDQEEACSCVG